jgi:FtsP/CotA-like multicopper oxidase with cupredoxin domain
MSHPIHLHGQRFLVLNRNGVANDNLVWKDTFVVAAGETVDILLELSNPGRWMLHCHVAEHLGAGMMTVFQVDSRKKEER